MNEIYIRYIRLFIFIKIKSENDIEDNTARLYFKWLYNQLITYRNLYIINDYIGICDDLKENYPNII